MIPPIAHFIWFGRSLPWVHGLAIRSAALRGGFERVILHHADELSATPVWPELLALPGFEARPIDVDGLLGPDSAELASIYNQLSAPAMRSTLARAAGAESWL